MTTSNSLRKLLRASLRAGLAIAVPLALGGADCDIIPGEGEGEGEGEAPIECFYGDESAAPEGELVYRTVDEQMATLQDGQEVPMILPPQGGKVILVGARVRNMDLCSLQANGGLFASRSASRTGPAAA